MINENKKTLLIVDDTKINIDILIELLGGVYDILVSLNSSRALELLEENHIDLILLDILMPGINGYDLCRVLKAKESTASIPVIFITANSDEESIDTAFEVGGIDYITKPFKALELLARIKTHLKTKELLHDLEESHKELEIQASQDHMTKLYNRRYFAEISKKIMQLSKRNKKELSVLMIDIDKFKNINDTYGHQVGDEVIISFANILKEFSRDSDVACRFGGEEFLLLLPETDLDGAMQIAEKLRKYVEEFTIKLEDDLTLNYTISIGVSKFDIINESNLELSIHRADEALYESKNSGRNLVSLKSI